MFRYQPLTRDQQREQAAAKGHLQHAPTQAMAQGTLPRPVNVRTVLDLGTLIYFTWRGRSFGVPPLPWKMGAELLDAYLEARSFGDSLTRETAPQYYRALNRMSKIMWRGTRLVGVLPRMLRRLGLIRNPYRRATEGELAELALFFLGRRTTTHAIILPTPTSESQQLQSLMT